MKMIGKAMIVMAAIALPMPVMAAEWEVSVSDDLVDVAITGNITYGDRQRFIFRKGNCETVQHTFSNFTMQAADFKNMKGAVLAADFNGDVIGAELIASIPAMSGQMLMFNFGSYDKDALLKYLTASEKISITFVDGNGHTASDYFDMPHNEWSTSGMSEAFDDAYSACIS